MGLPLCPEIPSAWNFPGGPEKLPGSSKLRLGGFLGRRQDYVAHREFAVPGYQ